MRRYPQTQARQALSPPPSQEAVTKIKSEPQLSSLPVRAPFTPAETEDTSALQAYYPISRRSMVYNWRYLRRPVADGPLNRHLRNIPIPLCD